MADHYVFWDTETTGLPFNRIDYSNVHMVSIAFIITDRELNVINKEYHVIKPNFVIDKWGGESIHGITFQYANEKGVDIKYIIDNYIIKYKDATFIAYNSSFDESVLLEELKRMGLQNVMPYKVKCCWAISKMILKRTFKTKLTQVYEELIGQPLEAHNALNDTIMTFEIFKKIKNSLNYEKNIFISFSSIKYLCNQQLKNKFPLSIHKVFPINSINVVSYLLTEFNGVCIYIYGKPDYCKNEDVKELIDYTENPGIKKPIQVDQIIYYLIKKSFL